MNLETTDPHAYEHISEALNLVRKECPQIAHVTLVEEKDTELRLDSGTLFLHYDPEDVLNYSQYELCELMHNAFMIFVSRFRGICMLAPVHSDHLH